MGCVLVIRTTRPKDLSRAMPYNLLMPVTLSCEICDSDFTVKPHRSDSANYCSHECQYKSMEKEFVKLSCQNCGESFEVKPSREGTAKYCSNDCYNDKKSELISGEDAPGWKGGRKVETSCEFCDAKFKLYKSRLEGRGARFCSNECKYQHLSDELSEPGADIRHTSEYRTWRQKVKERDGECVRCGSCENLHAHHITPVSEDESLATDIDNGETLCSDCHAEEHPELSELLRNN